MLFKVLNPPLLPEDGALAGLLGFLNENKVEWKTTCGGDEDRLTRAGKGEWKEEGDEEGKLGGHHGRQHREHCG